MDQVASHDSDIDSSPSPGRFRVKGLGVRPLPVLVSASPPQGELNGQRGLVPSNFLEGPGPEAGGSDREPGTPQAEGQVSEDLGSWLSGWVSMLLVWLEGGRGGQDGVLRGARPGSGPGAHCAQGGAASYRQREPSRGGSLPVCGPLCSGVRPRP